jgi:hypothetical protein
MRLPSSVAPLRIHAIVLALNEEAFIRNQLSTLYPFCAGISVLTQYDRDWYDKPVAPDATLQIVADFPDPEGKIHVVVRRWPDEAAARNSEMLALMTRPDRGIMSHGSPADRIRRFHQPPDYFWIVDADEIYDPRSVPSMLELLAARRPRGMRVHGFNYVKTWNRRVPRDVVRFCHFGFLRPGVLFKMRRTVSWNESRCAKLLGLCGCPDISAALWGFIECPPEVSMFHHGCWVGSAARLVAKTAKSSHSEANSQDYRDSVARIRYDFVETRDLPVNLQPSLWASEFFDRS